MISLPMPSFDALPAVEQAAQSPDAALDIAASFAALLVGLQQQPAAAMPLASLTPAAPATGTIQPETVALPAQPLPAPAARGTSYRLADFPAPLFSGSQLDALDDKPMAAPTAAIPAPQIAVNSATFGPPVGAAANLPPMAAGVQTPAAPVVNEIPVVKLPSDFTGLDAATVTVAYLVPEPAPTTGADSVPPQTEAVPLAPETRATVVETVPTTPSAIASKASADNSPPPTRARLAESTSAAASAPVLPVATALSAAPATVVTVVAVPVAPQPQHDMATGLPAATPPIAAVSAKATVRAVTAASQTDKSGDGMEEPADSVRFEQPLPSASASHMIATPAAVLDTESATAPAEVRHTAGASGVSESATSNNSAPAVTHLRVELAPPLLGEVVLELRHERDEIRATATVDRPATAEALKLVQTQVQQVLADQGIHVGSFEVSCRDGRQGSDNPTQSQPRTAGRSEPQVSAEPRKAAPERSTNALVDRYA